MNTATPPMNSIRTSSTALFCCGNCFVLSYPRGPQENAIYHFSYHMMRINSAPSSRTYPPLLLSYLLERSIYVIRFERWMNSEKDETRFFMPHPRKENSFIEVEDDMFAESSRREKWVQSWRYLKFRCDEHDGRWYICFVYQRTPRAQEGREVARTQRKVKSEEYGDDGNDEHSGEAGDGYSGQGIKKRGENSSSSARKAQKGVEYNPDGCSKEK